MTGIITRDGAGFLTTPCTIGELEQEDERSGMVKMPAYAKDWPIRRDITHEPQLKEHARCR